MAKNQNTIVLLEVKEEKENHVFEIYRIKTMKLEREFDNSGKGCLQME